MLVSRACSRSDARKDLDNSTSQRTHLEGATPNFLNTLLPTPVIPFGGIIVTSIITFKIAMCEILLILLLFLSTTLVIIMNSSVNLDYTCHSHRPRAVSQVDCVEKVLIKL